MQGNGKTETMVEDGKVQVAGRRGVAEAWVGILEKSRGSAVSGVG